MENGQRSSNGGLYPNRRGDRLRSPLPKTARTKRKGLSEGIGWASDTATARADENIRDTIVVLRSLWPRNSWIVRTSYPSSIRWGAKEIRALSRSYFTSRGGP